MNGFQPRDFAYSGATPAARLAYDRALGALVGWRRGVMDQIGRARDLAPAFVMAHALEAYTFLCSRDPARVRLARPILERARELPATEHERRHLAAIGALLDDDYDGARALLGDLVRVAPFDVLALHVAHSLDYAMGDVARLHDRVAAALPAWSAAHANRGAVLAMHAFGLVESGEYAEAERAARAALAAGGCAGRAHHVMAHVFEMSGRPREGIAWLEAHRVEWSVDSVGATHCWWHLALLHLGAGEIDVALGLYDERIRIERPGDLADRIDATALLWRIRLLGADAGSRWTELADAWAPHLDDAFCSFNDVHAMIAFVGARDWPRAERLERALVHASATPSRHGETTRLIGLPAVRAIAAFGRGEDALAIALLAGLPAMAHRMGGSHAQRDVLHLTLLAAVERVRRPVRRLRKPPVGAEPRHGASSRGAYAFSF